MASTKGKLESTIQAEIRVEAAARGMVLWRNNVGAAKDASGNFFRFGLANDSAKMAKMIKSSDLIGIRPVVITQDMVGKTFGQFVAREVKREDWTFKGTPREEAQLKFLDLVRDLGGDAEFASGPGTLDNVQQCPLVP